MKRKIHDASADAMREAALALKKAISRIEELEAKLKKYEEPLASWVGEGYNIDNIETFPYCEYGIESDEYPRLELEGTGIFRSDIVSGKPYKVIIIEADK